MYYVGVDAGGTKTTAALSDLDGKVVRTKTAGAANLSVLGKRNVAQLVKEIVRALLGNEELERIRWATFAFAGAGRKEERRTAKEIITGLGLAACSVMTDAELLYYAIHGDSQAILLEAGTGSVCLVRNQKGELQQIGGWGYLLGDQGSGYDIGRQAIREALKADETATRLSELTAELLSFYQIDHPKDLITRVHSVSNPQELVASCAKLVCEQALKGEPHAERIVDAAALALLQLTNLGVERLGTDPPYKMALAGGILAENAPVATAFKRQVNKMKLELQYVKSTMQPAAAAVLNSVKSSGKRISHTLMERMRNVAFDV